MTNEPTLIPIIVPGAPPRVAHEPAADPVLREANTADAPAIHQLIMQNLQAGHLLPRSLADVTARAARFVVAVSGEGLVLACGELAPLNANVAEVRSLVVREGTRGQGLGHVIVDELRRRARAGRYRTLCAFAHDPRFFVRFGFSIVPHTWLPEKVAADCWSCEHFQKCGQYAVVDTRLGRPIVPAPGQDQLS
jgi:amino-acid N-acetyltransferase